MKITSAGARTRCGFEIALQWQQNTASLGRTVSGGNSETDIDLTYGQLGMGTVPRIRFVANQLFGHYCIVFPCSKYIHRLFACRPTSTRVDMWMYRL